MKTRSEEYFGSVKYTSCGSEVIFAVSLGQAPVTPCLSAPGRGANVNGADRDLSERIDLLAIANRSILVADLCRMVRETDAAFSVVHMRDLVAQGQWREAIDYLSRFLRLDKDECLSMEAKVLHRSLFTSLSIFK